MDLESFSGSSVLKKLSPCKAVGINVRSSPGRQSLKVLVVNYESHPPRPGGHAVCHVVPRSQHGGRLDDNVVGLERGVREVEAIRLAPGVLL